MLTMATHLNNFSLEEDCDPAPQKDLSQKMIVDVPLFQARENATWLVLPHHTAQVDCRNSNKKNGLSRMK